MFSNEPRLDNYVKDYSELGLILVEMTVTSIVFAKRRVLPKFSEFNFMPLKCMNIWDFKSIHHVKIQKSLLFCPAHIQYTVYKTTAYKTKDSLEDGFYEHLFIKTIQITGLLCQKKNNLRYSHSNSFPLVALQLFIYLF